MGDLVDPVVDTICGVCLGQDVYFCPKHVDAAGNFTVWAELYQYESDCTEPLSHAYGEDRAYYFGEYNETRLPGRHFKGGFEKYGPTECSATLPPPVCRGQTGRNR